MITFEFSYPNNGNGSKIRITLMQAEDYCHERGCTSLTIETLSPKQSGSNYLKTYRFYKKFGFNPLDRPTYDPGNLMVYKMALKFLLD